MTWWHIVIICVVSYFVGNISFSRFLAKTKKQDITKLGSGNAGSTNILRNFGFKYGVINLVLDILKGFVPSFLAYKIFNDNLIYLYIAGISVMIGHIYPVIFKFKGGKGIASMLGVFVAADPIVTLIVIAIAAISWLLFKYGSVASFICVTALTVYEGIKAKSLLGNEPKIVCALLFVIFCITWYASKEDVMYAATHYRNGEIPNESAIKATIDFTSYKEAQEKALQWGRCHRLQKVLPQRQIIYP